jgi:hypothetical protein
MLSEQCYIQPHNYWKNYLAARIMVINCEIWVVIYILFKHLRTEKYNEGVLAAGLPLLRKFIPQIEGSESPRPYGRPCCEDMPPWS